MPKWDEEKSDEERYHHIRPEGVEDMRRLDDGSFGYVVNVQGHTQTFEKDQIDHI